MHPHGPCPLIPLQASRRRSLLALILLNWMFRALLPIVTFCVPRHPPHRVVDCPTPDQPYQSAMTDHQFQLLLRHLTEVSQSLIR
jgi:hypothetical protein